MTKKSLPIHKRVKKHEMVFEHILLLILVLFLLYLVIYVLGVWPGLTENVNLTTVAGAVISSYALVWQLHTAIKNKKVLVSLSLDAKVSAHDVFVNAAVTNDGTKSINPLMTNLYIMEGISKKIENDIEAIEFPPVTEHELTLKEGECFDCPVRMQCKKEEEALGTLDEKVEFPKIKEGEFSKKLHFAYNMRLLSYHSLLHIMPKETFAEEVIFRIPNPGYYRIFMIYTDKAWKDCICKSVVVHIKGNVNNTKGNVNNTKGNDNCNEHPLYTKTKKENICFLTLNTLL